MTRAPWALAVLLLAAGLYPTSVRSQESKPRAVAVIVDTSNSMKSNDPQRYTVQISQILGDLLDDRDELTVIGMASAELFCIGGASSSLALRLEPSNRTGFKTRLDPHLRYHTGTFFVAAVRTALHALSRHPDRDRMLLILADSGGFGSCSKTLTRELQGLHDQGALVAAVNLGSSSGAFDRNPAFDLTTPARDSHALVEAVAEIYQRFLGAKKVQTGRVSGAVEVEIAPHARQAFLVVAADGPVREIRADDAGNPGAHTIDPSYRGGGRVHGLDGVTRSYRILRLERPQAGRWTFRAPGLATTAGWMLIQDLMSLSVRLDPQQTRLAQGISTRLCAKIYDEDGREVDPATLPDLEVSVLFEQRKLRLRDDGRGCLLSEEITFDTPGRHRLQGVLETGLRRQDVELSVDVAEGGWNLQPEVSAQVTLGRPAPLTAVLEPFGDPSASTPPDRIEVTVPGGTVGLTRAGDGAYRGEWIPRSLGSVELTWTPIGSDQVSPTRSTVDVVGRLDLGIPEPVDLGTVGGSSDTESTLELGDVDVQGRFELTVRVEDTPDRSVLEIDPGTGWTAVTDGSVSLPLDTTGPRAWPLRLRVGSCPEGRSPDEPFHVVLSTTAPDGSPVQLRVPVTVRIVEDSWLHCWWPVLALTGGLLLTGIVIHGFWSPSRFAPRVGLILSQDEDVDAEGFFHPIRAQRGSGSGFYRDARIYLHPDFRLSRRSGGALARLRADGSRVRLRALPGASLQRHTADGDWEPVPPEETPIRFGQLFRDDGSRLFFELRNR